MAKINGFSSCMIPSNPDIEWCPAVVFDTKVTIDSKAVEVTIFETPKFTHTNRVIAGVIGPIACQLCAKACTDAYQLIIQEDVAVINSTVKSAETPVNIRLLNDSVRELSPEELSIEKDASRLEAAKQLLVLNGEPFLINQ